MLRRRQRRRRQRPRGCRCRTASSHATAPEEAYQIGNGRPPAAQHKLAGRGCAHSASWAPSVRTETADVSCDNTSVSVTAFNYAVRRRCRRRAAAATWPGAMLAPDVVCWQVGLRRGLRPVHLTAQVSVHLQTAPPLSLGFDPVPALAPVPAPRGRPPLPHSHRQSPERNDGSDDCRRTAGCYCKGQHLSPAIGMCGGGWQLDCVHWCHLKLKLSAVLHTDWGVAAVDSIVGL